MVFREDQNLKDDVKLKTTTASESSDLPDFGSRFEIIATVGKGRMGTVYKVKESLTGNVVAIKVIDEELARDKAALTRFQNEAKTMSQLTLENLANILDVGSTDGGLPFIVMDFVEGKSLETILAETGPIESKRVLDIALQICSLLNSTHANGIIHRDLKPGNVLITTDAAGKDKVVVVDFGIARLLPSASQNRQTHELTQTGEILGSPGYMSPEQCLGFHLDARSDIYSLGCLLYEILSGKPPFSASNSFQLLIKQIHDAPDPLGKGITMNKVALNLESIILKCMNKEKIDRYQDVSELEGDLKLVLSGKNVRRQVITRPATKSFRFVQIASFTIVPALVAFWLFIDSASLYHGNNMGTFVLNAVLSLCAISSLVFFFFIAAAARRLILGHGWVRDWWQCLIGIVMCVLCASCLFFKTGFDHAISSFAQLPLDVQGSTALAAMVHISALCVAIVVLLTSLWIGKDRRVDFWKFAKLPVLTLSICLAGALMVPQITAFIPAKAGHILWTHLHQYYASSELYEIATTLSPMDSKLREDAIIMFNSSGQANLTLDLVNRCIAQEPDNGLLYEQRSGLYLDSLSPRTPELAIRDANKAISLDPKRNNPYLLRALAHLDMQQYDEAIKDMDYLVEKTKNADCYGTRAKFHLAAGNLGKAIDDFTTQIEMVTEQLKQAKPGDYIAPPIEALMLRGITYDTMENTEKALADFNRVVSAPRFEEPWMDAYLAYCYKRLGDEAGYKRSMLKLAERGDDHTGILKYLNLRYPQHLRLRWN